MKILFLLLILFSTSGLFAHNYYFAFAEVEYNDVSQRIEATLSVSTHDLEKAMRIQHADNADVFNDISTVRKGSEEEAYIESYLLKHFKISADNPCFLKMIGFEVQMNGVTYFYFESTPFKIKQSITFEFDLLMNENELQQNKITFLYRGKSYTRPFLVDKKNQTINF